MVLACSSGTLTNVLPHRNAMPQTQDTTPHPVTVYSHRVDWSLCYPLMWNVTQEYTCTTTHLNVLGHTRPVVVSRLALLLVHDMHSEGNHKIDSDGNCMMHSTHH